MRVNTFSLHSRLRYYVTLWSNSHFLPLSVFHSFTLHFLSVGLQLSSFSLKKKSKARSTFFVIWCLETQRQKRKESHVQLQFPRWPNHFVLLFEISFRSVEVQVNMLFNGAVHASLHKTPLQMSAYIFIKATHPTISAVFLFISYLVSGFNKHSRPLPSVFYFDVNRRKM